MNDKFSSEFDENNLTKYCVEKQVKGIPVFVSFIIIKKNVLNKKFHNLSNIEQK